MKLVFDTNIFIEALRLTPKGVALINYFEKSDYELYVSSVVGFELFAGKSSKNETQQKAMQELLSYFEVQDLTWNVAKRAGELYRNGTHYMEFPDYIIAATALTIGAQVVTLNRKHFSQIPDLQVFDERKILS